MIYSGHKQDLAKSGIDETQAMAHGFSTITDSKQIAELLNWKTPARRLAACLAIRYFDAQGKPMDYYRLKPDQPRKDNRGKAIKYESALGGKIHLYFPRGVTSQLANVEVPLIITEGEKKALCGFLNGFACIGLPGVEGWSRKRAKDAAGLSIGERELHEDWENVPLEGRKVYFAFDSDRAQKEAVQRAEYSCAKMLQKRGAKVGIVSLPGGVGEKGEPVKQGLDDFLVSQGKEAFMLLLAAATEPKPIPFGLSESHGFQNYYVEEIEFEDGKIKRIRCGKSIQSLMEELFKKSGGFPKRIGSQLFVEQNGIAVFLTKPAVLMAWIERIIPPHPEHPEANPVHWAEGESMVTINQYMAGLMQCAESFEAIHTYPIYPPWERHYYLYPPLGAGDGTAFMGLIKRFEPASIEDRSLLIGFFLSLVCGLSPGQQPAWLFTSIEDDSEGGKGVGKSTVVQLAIRLLGKGISLHRNEKMEEFKKRLLSPEGKGARIIQMDNLKGDFISSAELESFITASTISGKEMYTGEGQLPNTFVCCITSNSACLSKDLAQRCITVKLKRPDYRGEWLLETQQYIDQNRWSILGDLITMLKIPAKPLHKASRWGAWEHWVLSRLHEPEKCQQIIIERQKGIDLEQSERDLVLQVICDALSKQIPDYETRHIFIPTRTLASFLNVGLGERLALVKVTPFLKRLGLPKLREGKHRDTRGWFWKGAAVDNNSSVVSLPDGWTAGTVHSYSEGGNYVFN